MIEPTPEDATPIFQGSHPTAEDLALAELLEAMCGIYPGDPDGVMAREAAALRQIPWVEPEVVVTYEEASA